MEPHYQLFTIETADRAGAVTAVAASFASRGVNIECFLANEFDCEGGHRRGIFVAVVEAESDYAIVLRKGLKCLDVVHAVSEPLALTPEEMRQWRARFADLSRACEAAVEAAKPKRT